MLISSMCKELLQLNNKCTNSSIKYGKEIEQIFSGEDTKLPKSM